MGLWKIDTVSTVSPGKTVRRYFHFDGQYNGQYTKNIPSGPVQGFAAPVENPPFISGSVKTDAQGYIFNGGSLVDLQCFYFIDVTCDDAFRTGFYDFWIPRLQG